MTIVFVNIIGKILLAIFILTVIGGLLRSCSSPLKNIFTVHQKSNKSVVIGFFNGVNTTEKQTQKNVKYLKDSFADIKKPIQYEYFYNYTDGLVNDNLEVFEQRMAEQPLLHNHYELLFDIMDEGGPIISSTIKDIPAAAGAIASLIETSHVLKITYLTNEIAGKNRSVKTSQVYREHLDKAKKFNKEGKRLIFLAHSQGNLFANKLYESLPKQTQKETVVIHVAPASQIKHGGHVLADKDYVISVLNITGNVFPISVKIPDADSRPPGLNGKIDNLGHGFVEIYINKELGTYRQIRKYLNLALSD